MNVSILLLYVSILTVSVLAAAYPGQSQGQEVQSPAATPSQTQVETSADDASALSAKLACKGPSWYVCPTEEEERFMHLFRELDNWDVSIKHFEDLGDKGFADHMRTKLARESSLTIAEAAQVKQVADQWIKSEEDRATTAHQLYTANAKAWRAAGVAGRDPVRQREHWATVDQAIAQLVTALGSREFSKLDLYTRHMDDRAEAPMEAGRQHAFAEQKAKQ